MTTNRGQNRMEEPQPDFVSGRATNRPDPKTVADQFTHQYYTVFSNYPRYLYRFYDVSSTMTVSEELENGTVKSNSAENQQGIHKLVNQLFGDTTVKLGRVLPQFSQNGGIVMQVTGTLLRKGAERAFSQSFFLAVQEKGFYVLNDILHITPISPATTPRKDHAPLQAPPKTVQPKPGPPSHIDVRPKHPQESPRVEHGVHPEHGPLDNNPPPPSKRSYADLLKEGGTTNGVPPVRGNGTAPKIPDVRVQPPVTPPSPVYTPQAQKPSTASSTGAYLGPNMNSRLGGAAGFQRNSSVFVRDVPTNVDENALRQVFEKYGGVTNVVIRNGRRDVRFAFVDFATTEAMEECLRDDKVLVNQRRLFVEEKKPLVLRNKQQRFRRAGSGSPGPHDNPANGNGGSGAFYG